MGAIKREVRCKTGAIPVAVTFFCALASKAHNAVGPTYATDAHHIGKAAHRKRKPEDLPVAVRINKLSEEKLRCHPNTGQYCRLPGTSVSSLCFILSESGFFSPYKHKCV